MKCLEIVYKIDLMGRIGWESREIVRVKKCGCCDILDIMMSLNCNNMSGCVLYGYDLIYCRF